MKKLVYFMVASVFLGAQILAVDIGIAKLSLYRISIALSVFFLLIAFIRNDRTIKIYPNDIATKYVSFFGVWLAYSILSVMWATSLSGWVKGNYFIGIGFLAILLIHLFIHTKADLLTLFKIVAGASLLHNVIGWTEILTGNYRFADLAKLDKYGTFTTQPGSRIPISIFANQNDYATLILASMFFVYLLLKVEKDYKRKSFYFVLLISSMYLIIRTDSRANLLALFLGVAFMVALKLKDLLSKRQIIGIATFGFLVVVVGLLFVPAFQQLGYKVASLLLDTTNEQGDSNNTRLNLIYNGFVFLAQTFGFGVGSGNIEYWMENNAYFNISTKYNMHNWWMEILTGYGILIFIGYVILFILILNQLARVYQNSSDAFIKQTAFVLFGYLGAFILSSISSASNLIIEWQWVIFGIIIAFCGYANKVQEIPYENRREQRFNLEMYIGGQNG